MNPGTAVAVAVAFSWLGLVLGISFIETPLKFRAPDVTLRIGLGIGRLVFRVVNAVEVGLAVIILIALIFARPAPAMLIPLVVAAVALAVQVIVIRPRLTRRTNAVLAGADAPRSRAHLGYVGLELIKVIALLVGGIAALAA